MKKEERRGNSLKKKLIVLNTTIMVGLGSVFATPSVNAASISDVQSERTGIKSDILESAQIIQELNKEQTKMNSQIAQIEKAMKENDGKIKKAKKEITDTEKDMDSLKKKVKALEERIAKREGILKERALAFQESGGDVNYIEVLLGSRSFRELIDRVGAVAAIVEADQEILSQQEADKAELEKKQVAVAKKLQSLKDMDIELKGMQSQIKEQKVETNNMKAKLENKELETKALKQALENKDAGLAVKTASIREKIKKEEALKASEKDQLIHVAEEVDNSSTSTNKESSSTGSSNREKIKKEEALKASEKDQLNRVAEEVNNSSTSTGKEELSSSSSSNREKIKKEAALKASEKDQLNRVAEEVNNSSTSTGKEESSSSSSKNNSTNKSKASEPETSSKPSDANVGSAITAGYKYIGNSSYVFGGGRTESDIANGRFDCSAFVAWAYKQAGVSLPASTGALASSGRQISKSQVQPGDLVFFNTYKTDGHVGIYVGNGKFIGSQSSTGVAIANMESGYWAEKFNGRVVRVN